VVLALKKNGITKLGTWCDVRLCARKAIGRWPLLLSQQFRQRTHGQTGYSGFEWPVGAIFAPALQCHPRQSICLYCTPLPTPLNLRQQCVQHVDFCLTFFLASSVVARSVASSWRFGGIRGVQRNYFCVFRRRRHGSVIGSTGSGRTNACKPRRPFPSTAAATAAAAPSFRGKG